MMAVRGGAGNAVTLWLAPYTRLQRDTFRGHLGVPGGDDGIATDTRARLGSVNIVIDLQDATSISRAQYDNIYVGT